MKIERALLVVAGRADSINASILISSGEVVAMTDVITGEILRCLNGSYGAGEVVRSSGTNVQHDNDPNGLPLFSRIVSPAPKAKLTEFRRRLRAAAPRPVSFVSGIWYLVIED